MGTQEKLTPDERDVILIIEDYSKDTPQEVINIQKTRGLQLKPEDLQTLYGSKPVPKSSVAEKQ